MPEGVIVRYRWTLAETKEAFRWHQKWQSRRFRSVSIAVIVVFFIASFAYSYFYGKGQSQSSLGVSPDDARPPITQTLIFVGAFIALYFFLRYLIKSWFPRRNHAKSASRDAEIIWQITATSLRNETANSVAESKWTAFNQAVQTPGGLLLYPQPRLFYWLPRHGFETEEGFESVTAWARERIKDFRVVRR